MTIPAHVIEKAYKLIDEADRLYDYQCVLDRVHEAAALLQPYMDAQAKDVDGVPDEEEGLIIKTKTISTGAVLQDNVLLKEMYYPNEMATIHRELLHSFHKQIKAQSQALRVAVETLQKGFNPPDGYIYAGRTDDWLRLCVVQTIAQIEEMIGGVE